MVSRRNYIAIVTMFLILFFMFQFTGVMKERLNEYGINEYEELTKTGFGEKDAWGGSAAGQGGISDGRPYVVYAGDLSEAPGSVVRWWCIYTKRELAVCESIAECKIAEEAPPEVLVADGSLVRGEEDVRLLTGLAGQGISIIFASLPDVSIISEYEELRELLGIRYVIEEETELSGMHLYEGFLLGGEAIYEADTDDEKERQDLEQTLPWYVTGAGTKTYLSGMLSGEELEESVPQDIWQQYGTMDGQSAENALLPAVIWRNSFSGAKIFCVNGSWLSDMSGIGILSAMMSEISSYELYPVVNAQNLVIAGYPSFAEENDKELQERYSQGIRGICREIVGPSLSSLISRIDRKATFMLTPQYDYEDEIKPQGGDVSYYLRLMKEERAEAGLYGAAASDTAPAKKLAADADFWEENAPDYAFLSLYLSEEGQIADTLADGQNGEIRTVALGENDGCTPPVSYAGDDVTVQRSTSTGVRHTFYDDFKVRAFETALGYSNVTLDLKSVAYPESEEDSWEKMSKKISSNLSTYWSAFAAFDATTLSESDARIRRFLALDFSDERTENEISLSVSNFEEEAWFLLRLSGEEVKSVDGGDWVKIEDGAYLILAERDELVIRLKQQDGLHY